MGQRLIKIIVLLRKCLLCKAREVVRQLLGKTILTEAEQDVSHDIMKELSYNIEGIRFHKRNSPIADFKKALTKNQTYWYMEEEYNIIFGKIYHAHNIGNNNEIPIYLEDLEKQERCLVGSLFILVPIFGDFAEATLKDVEGNRII